MSFDYSGGINSNSFDLQSQITDFSKKNNLSNKTDDVSASSNSNWFAANGSTNILSGLLGGSSSAGFSLTSLFGSNSNDPFSLTGGTTDSLFGLSSFFSDSPFGDMFGTSDGLSSLNVLDINSMQNDSFAMLLVQSNLNQADGELKNAKDAIDQYCKKSPYWKWDGSNFQSKISHTGIFSIVYWGNRNINPPPEAEQLKQNLIAAQAKYDQAKAKVDELQNKLNKDK